VCGDCGVATGAYGGLFGSVALFRVFGCRCLFILEVYFAGLLQLPCSAVADCSAKCSLIPISVRFCRPGYGSGWGLPCSLVMNGFWMISLLLGYDLPS
jgi:hypothetical protein